MPRPASRSIAVIALIILAAGCGGGSDKLGPDAPGPVAALTAITPTTIQGIASQTVSIQARGADASGVATPGAVATITVTGGGSAPTSVTASSEGIFTIPSWTLGSTPGANTLVLSAGSANLQFSSVTAFGPPASIAVATGNNQQVLAGHSVAPVAFEVRDAFNNLLSGIPVTFNVLTGGGSLSANSAITSSAGVVLAPTWTVGNSVVPQQLRASVGTFSSVASASIQSAFNISVRFYGPPMSPDQEALFTAAAARISAMLVGDVAPVNAPNVDLAAFCEEPGLPVLNELIDDIVIYASIATIDGPGQTLAQAGPCAARSGSSIDIPGLPVVGIMQFDAADLGNMAGAGSLQDVITHEMMHVLGIGTFWNELGLLTGYNTSSVAYVGANGGVGCRGVGGSSICAGSVPVENTGGAGTANGHWRESVFGNEIMTGFANAGGMPISRMTIGAFQDLGYVVNHEAAGTYQIPGTVASGASLSVMRPQGVRTTSGEWEIVRQPKILISRDGKVQRRQ